MLDGHVFCVTGGARGIGEGIVRAALSHGARVMVSDLDEAAGRALVEDLSAEGHDVDFCPADVTDETAVAKLMTRVDRRFGGLDVLVNNAGIHEAEFARGSLRLETMAPSTFRRVLEVNVIGPFLCSKFALPALRRSAHASIINAASVCSHVGYPGAVAYGPSKGAVALLTKNLAVDLAADGVRVNCYCPASIDTRKLDPYTEGATDPEATRRALTATHLVPRLGLPSDVAGVVCFLASPAASFVTGAEILVDGGSLAWRGVVDEIGLQAGT